MNALFFLSRIGRFRFIRVVVCLVVCGLPVKSLAEEVGQLGHASNKTDDAEQVHADSFIEIPELSAHERQWISDRIYENECASNSRYLTYWGKGEEFPSFGIGHFIWYTEYQQGIYQQTFPALVEYVAQFQTPPKWLSELAPFYAPWQNKTAFDQALASERMRQLRQWLLATRSLQGDFIVKQFVNRVTTGLYDGNLTLNQRSSYKRIITRMLRFKQGRFALIDYVNFKGIGSPDEQYQGEQWGLFSVLDAMKLSRVDSIGDTLLMEKFIQAAKSRLQLRVRLAPKHRGEERWLAGWFKRLDGYAHNGL